VANGQANRVANGLTLYTIPYTYTLRSRLYAFRIRKKGEGRVVRDRGWIERRHAEVELQNHTTITRSV
jgi:hypothetical protein